MGCQCSGTCWLIGICILQLITIAARQTFDFLGLQWSCIVANFCQLAGVCVGLCGAYRQKPRLIAVYSTWTLIWIGWNTYIVFLYLSVGSLHLQKHLVTLNLGLSDSYTWFSSQGWDCTNTRFFAVTPNPTVSDFCFLDYRYIEVFLSGLQIFLSIVGFSIACFAIGILRGEEERFDLVDGVPANRIRKKGDNPSEVQLQPLVGHPAYASSSA